MQINFLVNEIAGGWEPDDVRLGGTEESVREWAIELSCRGHDVFVYFNGRMHSVPGNVVGFDKRTSNKVKAGLLQWRRRGDYQGLGDICINIKSSDVLPKEPTLYLTNETDATSLDLEPYAGVIWPSQWAVDNIETNAKRTFILPHGYDPGKIYPGGKFTKQCFYASSPDRGLETLLEVWPKVHEKHPDACLILTYGAPAPALPGVFNLGEVDEDTMSEIFRTSDFWLHPANGGELFCMTGKKAQVSGCIPVIIPVMALSETVKRGYFANRDDYADTLISALSTSWADREKIRQEVIENANAHTWQESTDILESIIKSVL